jgi:periplasmic protein TonB
MTRCGRAGFADRAASSPLLAALVASVALHAALVAGLPDFRTYSARPATAPLNARLAPAGRVAAVSEPAAVAMPSADRRASERATPAPSPAAEPVLALGTPTLAPRPGADALEAGSLAQYRLALIGAAKRLKQYPAQAIDGGLEGRVDVRLVIGGDGAPAAVVVKRSSRHEVLDREAIETLRRASAETPIPPALRNRDIVVEIPLLYELKSAS